MKYKKICEYYEKLEETSKGLEKTSILAEFLNEIGDNFGYIYLMQGKVFADYDSRELGISHQLAIRTIARASGVSDEDVVSEFKETGDLGRVTESILKEKKNQKTLFSSELTVDKVLKNFRKLSEIEGKGTVDIKLGLIIELLNSATPKEAKYIIRTALGDLKVGIGSGLIRDAIVKYCFKPENIEEKKAGVQEIQEAYDKATDFALVFEKAKKGELENIKLTPGKPVKVMLFPKAKGVEDAFRIVGRPAAFEYKYDGFRVMINKDEKGWIKIFTRRLEEVTKQFPEILKYVKENVKGKSFIIDAEAVGYDSNTKEYTPFQAISQRIKRKYGIEEMARRYPIELEVFDIIYYEGKDLIEETYENRRKLIEKIVKEKKYCISLAEQIVTDSEEDVEKFYKKAIEDNQEGLMGKNLKAPYKPGSRVGYAVKIKPEDKDFDLVITGAEWGTGKRAGWLTSFDVSCMDENGELMEVGKVSTGLKELEEQGLSYKEMTEKMQKLILEEHGRNIRVRPRVVVTVQYQNIQKSPTYTSGYALRFPRIKRLRPDRGVEDIARIEEIEREAK